MYRSRVQVVIGLVIVMVLSLTLMAPLAVSVEVEAQAQGGTTVIYNLYATDGYMYLADGTRVYTYGFIGGRQGSPLSYLDANGVLQTLPGGVPAPTGGPITAAETPLKGNAQIPAPVIYATVGDVVEIRLKNLGTTVLTAPNDPHTVHLHGLDVDAANDGVPETSVAAVPANDPANPGAGNVVVYMFTANRPGTYMYHCHQEADIHVQMGMYGALVIYNSTDAAAAVGPGQGMGGNLYGFHYDKDIIMLLNEIDVRQHLSEEFALAFPANPNAGFNPANYKPQYWLVNGLSFPNTVHVDGVGPGLPGSFVWSDWIAAHPGYETFIQGSVSSTAGHPAGVTPGEKVLVRVINLGFEQQPMHIHGFHPKIIGADQRAWDWSSKDAAGNLFATGLGLERNTFSVGSGESYELLIDFGAQSLNNSYAPNSAYLPETKAAFGLTGLMPTAFTGGTQSKVDAAGAPLSNTLAIDNVNVLPMPDPFTPGAFYIGGPQVDGVVGPTQPVAGTGQFFPWHNHDDYKSTNNGVYPGGQFVMLQTLP